jgi:hypothetical protein
MRSFGEFRLDSGNYRLWRGDEGIHIPGSPIRQHQASQVYECPGERDDEDDASVLERYRTERLVARRHASS